MTPALARLSFAPGSARMVTVLPSMVVVWLSATVPVAIFTNGRPAFTPLSSVPHGAALVHAVPEPPLATYATCCASAQLPSGRQTFDAVHSACAVHSWHWLDTQAGVAPEQAPDSAVVHCTH